MKLGKLLSALVFATTAMFFVATTTSCDPKEPSGPTSEGVIKGTVTSESDNLPIEGVTVTVADAKGKEEATATTDSEGKYEVKNLNAETTHRVTFSKQGFAKSIMTVAKKNFINKIATVDASLALGGGVIEGTVTNANGNTPIEGVTVRIVGGNEVTTDAQGKYILEDLTAIDYEVEFVKSGLATTLMKVMATDFASSNKVTLDVTMTVELLRGKSFEDLKRADKWYYNEYRGGRGATEYPRWDWACDYMATLNFVGAWQEQSEGSALQIRNSEDQQSNPADLNMFDSYVYGSKMITADNKIMTLQVRTHNATQAAPTNYGVQVIDLAAANPTAEKIGGVKTLASESYVDVEFDLSSYVGKEVLIAVGTYRAATGDYWKQLPIKRIGFATRKLNGWEWLPGTEVSGLTGWKMTNEMVRSSMPHVKKQFTGISPQGGGNNDQLGAVYQSWRGVAHIGAEWAFVPLHKDPEVFPSEGYIIKTRGNTAVNTNEPESYMYAKFAIAAGNNQMTLKSRTFGSNYTFFKLTSIDENGTVKHIAPKSNTAQDAAQAENGCWKFKHDKGGANAPADYASFVYDLSEFNGKSVMFIFGVFKGETNTDENKLVFYNIAME